MKQLALYSLYHLMSGGLPVRCHMPPASATRAGVRAIALLRCPLIGLPGSLWTE